MLTKLADLIDANVTYVADAEIEAMGQRTAIASGWIVPATARTFRYYAGKLFICLYQVELH